jgi:hypothetical protein
MSETDTTTAPAPTPTQPDTSEILANASPKELADWRQTGELPPMPVPAPVPDDDDPDEPDDEPEPDVQAAVPARTISKRQQKLNDKIRQGVEAELARREALGRSPAPAARPEPQPAPSAAEDDPEPQPTNLAKYPGGEYDPKYVRDVTAWDRRQERKHDESQAQARVQHEQQETSFRTAVKATSEAFSARFTADPTFKDQIDQGLMEALIPASQLPAGMSVLPIHIIAQELLGNPETAPDVTHYLSTHPAELARLTALDPRGVPVLSVNQLIREMGRIEAGLKRTAPEPPNTITSAPSPPTRLGDRSTAPVDAEERALEKRDYVGYKAAADARDLAARTR